MPDNAEHKALQNIIFGFESKVNQTEEQNQSLAIENLKLRNEIQGLNKKIEDMARGMGELKTENERQKDIMKEMAQEKIDARIHNVFRVTK